MYPESLSEGDIPPEETSFTPPVFDVTLDDYSISDGVPLSQRTPDHLVNPGLLIKLRESHQLSILSLLVRVNVDESAL